MMRDGEERSVWGFEECDRFFMGNLGVRSLFCREKGDRFFVGRSAMLLY
ncbi:hypothetical protein OGM63_21885 [Plectonema radiosum NIES-515]|uniref:Uncharacterized protein n=1 Tax=Plectonema radiosum NIES-515 TaxID=2986073 RepID=A0ABT3B429_9CYAN|nr:hypothetical protein [Plectonema radiosum]MCV3216127.1 hypothetical protein [Plectonema radiosum NIES-515]